MDRAHDVFASITASHAQALTIVLDLGGIRFHIHMLTDRLFGALKRTMGLKSHAMARKDQGITCNTGSAVVSLTQTAINHKQLAITTYWFFTLTYLNWRMAIDDMASIRIKAELLKDHAAHILGVVMAIVRITWFMVSRLIVDKVALKWLHHTTGQRTIKATPQVVHEIE